MKVLQYQDLPQGGFNGLEERRFVMSPSVFGPRKIPQTFNGLGRFVYLADASFLPFGETGMHPHREVDVISVMAQGEIAHEGSLEHGSHLKNNMAQVQRAGGEGFSHNEVNPSSDRNQLIQIWVLPDEAGEPAGFKTYSFESGTLTPIYGGQKDQDETFYSQTGISVGLAKAGDTFTQEGEVMAYLPRGAALVNGTEVAPQSLVHSEQGIRYEALDEEAQVIFIYHQN